MSAARAIAFARAHRKKFLAELTEFVGFPTISAQPKHEGDIKNCANWLAEHLHCIGLDDVRIIPTKRHPLVSASWEGAPGRPTLLIYGHYDVQPVDPLNKWRTPPFEPTIRGADLFGRGASDDKGQMFTHVKALEAYLQTVGALPVNVKCLFDGEEEIGSPSLLQFVARNDRKLAADAAVISDTPMLGGGRPAICYAVRGALYLELEVRGPKRDLHSGNFGGAVHNPLQALCEIIATFHDAHGRIAIPGLYRRVRHWLPNERSYMAHAGPSQAEILSAAQTERSWGESGYSAYEQLTIRPALTVNGIISGYQGPGPKGIVPARALAKLSFRLVPDQDPHEIDRLFREHVAHITPNTVRSAVRTLSSAMPAVADRGHPAMSAAARAYRLGFGARPVFLRSGGTIPIVSTFHQSLGIPTVLMGFALPDDQMHAPNEKFHLPNFFNGIATSIHFLAGLGKAQDFKSRTEIKPLSRTQLLLANEQDWS
jgi:acetylornithine deacetylase/succinyl-diaminopimelate desuccinylase-like protein